MLGNVVLILLILMLIGGLPHWPYSRNWGYGPSSILGALLVIFLVAMLLQLLPVGL